MNNIELNTEIITAHTKHYETSPTGLVIPTESPNGNGIHHLYSTGEVTWQKGGWAYLQRSEFTLDDIIPGYEKLELKFVNIIKSDDESEKSYVILTKDECLKFREKMKNLISKS